MATEPPKSAPAPAPAPAPVTKEQALKHLTELRSKLEATVGGKSGYNFYLKLTPAVTNLVGASKEQEPAAITEAMKLTDNPELYKIEKFGETSSSPMVSAASVGAKPVGASST